MYDATTITRKEFQSAIEAGIEAARPALEREHIEALRQVGREATSTRVGTFGFGSETGCPLTQAGIYTADPDAEYPAGILDFYSAFDRELLHCGSVVTITDTPVDRFIAWYRGLFKREG